MEPIEELTHDLSWRETELALLKVFFQRSDVTQRQHAVLAKAAWSLLYAHYEGYAKFCLTLFFERAAKSISQCHLLPTKTKAFALSQNLKKLRNLETVELLQSIESFSDNIASLPPQFPEIDTKSNLWPNVLEDLLDIADIKCISVDKNRILLKSLVGKRNGIAHGAAIQANFSDYMRHETAVYEVMYDLAFQVDDRLKTTPFC